MTRRRLWYACTAGVSFAVWFWAMHKTVPRIGIGRTFDGREVYSFHEWTFGTYCWAAAGVLSGCAFVAATVLFVISLFRDGDRHGFPIR